MLHWFSRVFDTATTALRFSYGPSVSDSVCWISTDSYRLSVIYLHIHTDPYEIYQEKKNKI